MHDRRAEPSEETDQLHQGAEILQRGHGPGGMAERLVADTARFEVRDIWPGGRRAHYLISGIHHCLELRAEQEFEADAGGSDVDHDRAIRGHAVTLA